MMSPLFRRALSMRAILLLELWAWLGTIAFLVWPNVYVLSGSSDRGRVRVLRTLACGMGDVQSVDSARAEPRRAQFVIVTGAPAGIRRASQVIAALSSRMHP
jgi:hypothetical protein